MRGRGYWESGIRVEKEVGKGKYDRVTGNWTKRDFVGCQSGTITNCRYKWNILQNV